MAELVLLVDDDRLPMQYYVRALEQREFKVRHCLEPDSALDFLEKKAGQIVAVILDIMLPPGKAYEREDTNEGLRTGVFLLNDLREKCPIVPVVVLTNVKNPDTLNEFEGRHLVTVTQKMDCPPFELADLVEEMVNAHDQEPVSEDKGE